MGLLTANSRAFFVTGTDTEVGKTFFTVALLKALNARDFNTAAYKPIAAGCQKNEQGLRNEDALMLQEASSIDLTYAEVNPIALKEAIAPHLAADIAKRHGESIDLSLARIKQGFLNLLHKQADVVIVEGAGGWRLPLGYNEQGEHTFLSDFVSSLNLSVILVVGMRLGCLNHAMLTADSIRQHGLKVSGWVANCIEPNMPHLAENIESLRTLLNAPLIATLPFLEKPKEASSYIDLSALGF